MPKVKANNITINYDQQGTGDPLILIPYLAADHACSPLAQVTPSTRRNRQRLDRISLCRSGALL